MHITRYLVLLLAFYSLTCNAQRYIKGVNFIFDQGENPIPIMYEWMGTDSRLLTTMKLTYKKPKGFKEVGGCVCFEEYPKIYELFTCLTNCLQSKDDQFYAFISVYRPFTQKDVENYHSLFRGKKNDLVDKQHMHQIKAKLKEFYGEEKAKDWKKLVIYYPEEKTKSIFNADTVIRFSLEFEPQDRYKKKFKYMDALFLQKKGRGYINLDCFYTEKAKKRLDRYWRKIEGMLKYED